VVAPPMWLLHLSDEQRSRLPAKALPFGFDSGILPSALRAAACGVVQNRFGRFCRRIAPGLYVARLANALRLFDAPRAAYPNQCVRNAAHGEF
jgi:hypothetical protein